MIELLGLSSYNWQRRDLNPRPRLMRRKMSRYIKNRADY